MQDLAAAYSQGCHAGVDLCYGDGTRRRQLKTITAGLASTSLSLSLSLCGETNAETVLSRHCAPAVHCVFSVAALLACAPLQTGAG